LVLCMGIYPSPKYKQTGFSLIEVLVFVSVLNLFFILALTVTVVTLRNFQENEHRIVASHYLDQLKEWLMYEKEKDWNSFSQKTSTYCFNDLSWSNANPCSFSCPGTGCLNIYNRQATFVNNGDGTSTVELKISWSEINQTKNITSNILFSAWEK